MRGHLLGMVSILSQQRFDITLRMENADLHAYKIIINFLKFYRVDLRGRTLRVRAIHKHSIFKTRSEKDMPPQVTR